MASHMIGTRRQWLAARLKLLEAEKRGLDSLWGMY
jgi:hypothetical protein